MTYPISKKISGKKYHYYEKYWTKEEALKIAIELKEKNKKEGVKIRTYIEEIEEGGEFTQMFLPVTKFYLWIND